MTPERVREALTGADRSGEAPGPDEWPANRMSRNGPLRRSARPVSSDVRLVRLRSTGLTSHPHMTHFLHAVVHPRRVYEPTDPAMKKRLQAVSNTVNAAFDAARTAGRRQTVGSAFLPEIAFFGFSSSVPHYKWYSSKNQSSEPNDPIL